MRNCITAERSKAIKIKAMNRSIACIVFIFCSLMIVYSLFRPIVIVSRKNSLKLWARSSKLSTVAVVAEPLIDSDSRSEELVSPKKTTKRSDRSLPAGGHFYSKADDENSSPYTDGEVKFTVYGEPVALSRHRVTKRGFMYNPSAKFQADFLSASLSYLPPAPLEGAISMKLIFYFPRPKLHYGTGKNSAILKSNAESWHTKRSDIDNLAKFVLDALNSHAYKDDSQVSMLYTAKLYTEGDPCVKVQIRRLPEDIRGKDEDDLIKSL